MSAWSRFVRGIAVALVVVCAGTGAAQAQKWSKAAPFPEASEEVYGIAVGGKFYVFGGLAPGWKPKGLVYEYDPASDKWTKKKNMPLASHHLGLGTMNGKVYVFGGFRYPEGGPAAWQPLDNAWEYDPAADTWKALKAVPTKRGSPNVAQVNGKFHVIGGAGLHPGSKETVVHPAKPHRALGTHEVYDPAADSWETRSAMPTARNHAAAGVVNNKIYIIGGRLGAAFITRASNTDIVEEYDVATDQWGALKAPMPIPRSASAWGTHNGKIYVAGGEQRTSEFQRTFRAVQAYDPASNRWTALPPMQFPRHGLAGDILDGKFHLVSGDAASGGAPGTHIDTDVHEVLAIDAK